MLNKLAVKITTKLLSHKVITDEMSDIYIYGFELLLSFLFSTTIIVIIGAILGRIIQTFVFLTIFIFLRSFTGGYHANTYAVCSVVTFSVFGAVVLLSELLAIPLICYMILAILGSAIIVVFAPIENPNKKISDVQKRRYKAISMILFLVFTAVGALLCHMDIEISTVIFLSLVADLLLLFVKNRKKGENNHEVFGNHSY